MDNWLVHFGAAYVVFALLIGACGLLVGIPWLLFIMKRTGYRPRDLGLLLLAFIPISWWWLPIIFGRVLWRATSTVVYWSPHPDHRSEALAAWTSPRRWLTELRGA